MRAQRARADALVGMAVADEAVEHKASVAHARTVHWPQLQRHMLCTAAAPHPSLHSSVGLQLSQIALNCNAAEKALLADVTEAHPDATYVELLRLFKVRRSVADWALVARIVHRACCALPAHTCSQLPRLTLCSHLRCLFVCLFDGLFVCLFVCLLVFLFATGLCATHR